MRRADEYELKRIEFLFEALRPVAGLGRALRRSALGADYIGYAIEGRTAAALLELALWAEQLSGSAARALEARIRACLGHGDRTVLGVGYARRVVEGNRRRVVTN